MEWTFLAAAVADPPEVAQAGALVELVRERSNYGNLG